ncbi:MAG: patatin-like phospholipase family protein [Candidatus Cloacimonadales bacterium]
MKKIGIALGGGGARGLSHIKFLEVLDELGAQPSIISGTSIGAIVGAFYASGMEAKRIEEILDKINLLDFSKMIDLNFFSNKGMLKGKAFEDFLEEMLPIKKFEDLRIPLKIVATNFWKRESIVFDSGDLIPAIRASISVPGIFSPVKIGDVVLTDGGATNPVPFDIILDDCELCIAVDVSGMASPDNKDKIPNINQCVLTTFHIMEKSVVENKLKMVKPDIYLKPKLYDVELMEFHKYKEILKSVQEDSERLRVELTRLLEKKNFFFNKK